MAYDYDMDIVNWEIKYGMVKFHPDIAKKYNYKDNKIKLTKLIIQK